jgi:protoporphyrinogen/coproporphyrinogen III oxidase
LFVEQQQKHIVVIGGGITGLSTAHYLLHMSRESGAKISVTVIERSGCLGGSIQTLRKDGFVIEKGPDSFLARKGAILRLSRELGLDGEWVGMNPSGAKSYIYLNDSLHPMPEGLALGIPTRIMPFLRTGLLSVSGKARAALDFILPRRIPASGDEAIGSLVGRRLGREVADHLVSPVLAGIYASDLDSLSTAATFPQLLKMENEHRSIILGMLASRKTGRQAPPRPPASGEPLPPHLAKSMFLSFKGGLITLVERLEESLRAQGVRILTQCSVAKLAARDGGAFGYEVLLTDGTSLPADGVVLAIPADQAAALLSGGGEHGDGLSQSLRRIPNVSVANVAMAFEQGSLPESVVKGSGFVIPRDQGLTITACTWASSKWLHAAPAGKVLLRAYIGHSQDQSHVRHDDDALIRLVKEDLKKVLGVEVRPTFIEISRHPEAMPQYTTGHLERLNELERLLPAAWPGVVLTGRSYRGVGIPDCIQQGHDAAKRMTDMLHTAYSKKMKYAY